MPRKYTDEELDRKMVLQLVEAIYPILIPIEEQDIQTQDENQRLLTMLATKLWRGFQAIH